MQLIIYDKTEKGREEIATRHYQLPSRMRSLLVLIDGKKSDAELIHKISGLGLNLQNLQELLDQGFIQGHALEEIEEIQAIGLDDTLTGVPHVFEESRTVFEAPNTADGWTTPLDVLMADNGDDEEVQESRVDMIKRFMSDTIKESLGFKGFFLQRKVQKAHSLEELHALRRDYVTAILHSAGKDKAVEMRDAFDQRLYARFSLDDPEFLEN